MNPKESASPLFALLYNLDAILDGVDFDNFSRHQEVLDCWEQGFPGAFPGRCAEDAIQQLADSFHKLHTRSNPPKLPMETYLLALAYAYKEAGKPIEYSAAVEEGLSMPELYKTVDVRIHSQYIVPQPVRSTMRKLRECQERMLVQDVASNTEVFTKNGKLKNEVRTILTALSEHHDSPLQKLEVVADRSGLTHGVVRKWSPKMQQAGLIQDTKDGWVATEFGNTCLKKA